MDACKTLNRINILNMNREHKLKRPTIILLFVGTFLMSFNLLTRHFFNIPVDLVDFLKGLGVGFILSSLFVQRKLEKKAQQEF